jgi:ribosomal large subunit pseudouridine synthase F (EC 5.4.99.-)
MRINKYISDSGYCSRREADKLIEQGSVTINGKKSFYRKSGASRARSESSMERQLPVIPSLSLLLTISRSEL